MFYANATYSKSASEINTEWYCLNWKEYTVKPVYNDHLWNKTYYLWFIQ